MPTLLERVTDLFYVAATIIYVIVHMILFENPLVVKFQKQKPTPKGLTAPDFLGPEIKLGAPVRKYSLIEEEGTKEMPKVIMRGKVTYPDNTPITNAKIHIWHPDSNGRYSIFGFDCRGIILVDKSGAYEFESCVPGCLTFESMLKTNLFGLLKGKFYRPGHFHVKIDYGNKSFVTQVYTTSMYMKEDTIKKSFGQEPLFENLVELQRVEGKYDKAHFECRFDFVLPK